MGSHQLQGSCASTLKKGFPKSPSETKKPIMEIAVALSGGIDSAVAAYLLKERGHRVWGITMIHHREALETLPRVEKVARILSIPLEVINLVEVFQERVVVPFAQSYARGLTPNPCPLCNRKVKMGTLMEKALALGAQRVATGHYARVEEGPRLLKGLDMNKDQSYFLALLSQGQLERLVLPLGHWTRKRVEEKARELGLGLEDLKSSQEICFLKGHYTQFLKEQGIDPGPGPLVDLEGRVLGTHKGFTHYTLGQRRGLGAATGKPLYVVKILPEENKVVVGPAEALMKTRLKLAWIHWINYPPGPPPWGLKVRIRYRHREVPAVVKGGGLDITFLEPQRAPTPGQIAVFYRDQEVLGGGEILESFN